MLKKRLPDIPLLFICGALITAGVLILASVSSGFSLEKTGSSFTYLGNQVRLGLLPGLVLGTVAFLAPLSIFRRGSLLFLIGALVIAALVFVPGLGYGAGGAHRWIALGEFSFQPAELLKLAFVLYAASWLASRMRSPKSLKFSQTFLPFAGILTLISMLLVAQRDLGTLGIIVGTGFVLYFLAETPLWHSAVLFSMSTVAFALFVASTSYRLERLRVFLTPDFDPLGKGYQVKQALIAVGSGGLFGTGLGMSFQKFGILPAPMSDTIFAIFAEETGFIGSVLLVLLFGAFAWRAFVIATRVQDRFASLTAAGIGTWIFLQATVHIGANLSLVPLTGIPLPFISHGGSALLSTLLACGILLNVSKYTRSPSAG